MPDVEALKRRVCEAVDRRAAELIETADWIHAHPEIGHQEVEASKRLPTACCEAGGHPGRDGHRGHGDGLQGRARRAARAAAASRDPGRVRRAARAGPRLRPQPDRHLGRRRRAGAGRGPAGELDGSIWVLGTPAEESAAPNSGGKVHMVNAGIFDDVDAAIMFHPGTETAITPGPLAGRARLRVLLPRPRGPRGGRARRGHQRPRRRGAALQRGQHAAAAGPLGRAHPRHHPERRRGGQHHPRLRRDPLSHARRRLRVPGRDRRAGGRVRRGRRQGHRLPARVEGVHAGLREHHAQPGAAAI